MSKERKRDERPPAAAGKEKDSRLGLSLVQSLRCADASCSYFLAAAVAAVFAAASAYFLVKRSTRPAVSRSFCFPVKKGWQLEQISTFNRSPFMVERVWKLFPHAQWTVTA